MHAKATTKIDSIWNKLAVGQPYRTPDNAKGAVFTMVNIHRDFIVIETEGDPSKNRRGSHVGITQASFISALEYLYANQNTQNNRCPIASNNKTSLAGPLCRASRIHNGDTRCITYILPILKKFELVEINGSRPNRTWYT